MQIIYDFELDAVPKQLENIFSDENKFILDEMKKLVERSLSSLKTDIEWQSGQIILVTSNLPDFEIKPIHVTDDLKYKIERSIRQQDLDHIVSSLLRVFR